MGEVPKAKTTTFFIAKLQHAYCAEVAGKILGPQYHKACSILILMCYSRAHTELSEAFPSVSKDTREVSCSNPEQGWLPSWNAAFRCSSSHSRFEVALRLRRQSIQTHPSGVAHIQLSCNPKPNLGKEKSVASLHLELSVDYMWQTCTYFT